MKKNSVALLLFCLFSFLCLASCGKESGNRVSAIDERSKGSIDYAQAQLNLRNREPYIINEGYQINASAMVNGFSEIKSDGTRSFTIGSPSDPNVFFMEDVDCKNYRLRIKPNDWFDAEAGKMTGRIAYVVCHLPSSQF
jgi:hypothetical protein